MILLRVLALAHDALQAVRDHVHVTCNLGARYSPEDRGLAIRAWALHVQLDGDGLMVLRTGALVADDDSEDDEGCEHDTGDPDAPPACEAWVVMPDAVRSWLERVAEGETVDDVMTQIELAGVGEEVEA